MDLLQKQYSAYFFLQYTAIYSNLSSYFLKSDLFLKQNRKC